MRKAKKTNRQPKQKRAAIKTAEPAEAAVAVEEKKVAPILEAFGKVYLEFLAEQRTKLEELKAQFSDDPAAVKYFENSFTAVFHNDEYVERLFSYWVNHGVLPNAKRGWKNLEGRLSQSKAHAEKRQAEWKAYVPWLDAYFRRNPSLSLSSGRSACAKKFKVTPKTVERRTRGYRKPVTNQGQTGG